MDWGLYSNLLGHFIEDLAGVGPVYLQDLIDFMKGEAGAVIVYKGDEILIQEYASGKSFDVLPSYVNIVDEEYERGKKNIRLKIEEA